MERNTETRRSKREIVIKRDCKFCIDQMEVDYRQIELLRKFVTERGKILPRRITGTCASHQRRLAQAIKRARVMLFMR